MQLRPGNLCLLVASVLSLVAGCMGAWRPSADHIDSAATRPAPPALQECLRAGRLGRWVYERRALPLRDEAEVKTYSRRVTVDRIKEGQLERRAFLPVERYLAPAAGPDSRPSDSPSPPAGPWREKQGMAVFFRVDEPLAPIPADLVPGELRSSHTGITYYDYRGLRQGSGTLDRQVEIEGYEDVDCPAGRFEQCLRIRVDLEIRFPWFLVVNLTTYVWYSPFAGEVQRVQRFSGWFLIFWFGTADEYRLISWERTDDPGLEWTVPGWSAGALLLDGAFPQPRIAGMVIDLAESP